MYKRILVPIDGSDPSWRALEYARVLGEKFDSEIIIFHVIQPHYALPAVAINGEVPFVSMNFEEIENTGHKLMDIAKEKMQGYSYLKAYLEFGHPAERILTELKEGNYDLIVIGSRGLSGIAEFFLGSISDTVSHHSPIPIMIVK
jgi:nucleotide-binding universal stress UspA family protein